MADINYSDLPIKSTPSVPGDFVIITDSEDGDLVKIQNATHFKGEQGLGITWKGNYSNSITYQVNDAVLYNTKTYICTAITTGNLPTNTSLWSLMVDNGGTVLPTYTITNPTTDRAIDLSNMTLNELANVVGTLIEDIKSGLKGPQGLTGVGIASITLISGTHAPGTLDTYRITLQDASFYDFQVYNGANGTNGTNGTNGQGVPTGGTTGQALVKIDGTDYNTQWSTLTTDIVNLTEDTTGDVNADYFVKNNGTGANTKIKVIKYMASDSDASAGTNQNKYINPKQAKDNYGLQTYTTGSLLSLSVGVNAGKQVTSSIQLTKNGFSTFKITINAGSSGNTQSAGIELSDDGSTWTTVTLESITTGTTTKMPFTIPVRKYYRLWGTTTGNQSESITITEVLRTI